MTPLAFILLLLFILSGLLLAYIYVGYPLMVLLLARFYRHPVQKREITPSVTVVIPTFNEEAVIREKLENTLLLDYPREHLQILVSDDASKDSTVEIVKTYASQGVELSVGSARSGKAAALNRAFERADGEIVVTADADILPNPDALRKLVANFADERVGCVMPETKMAASDDGTVESSGLYWRYEARIRRSESEIHSTVAATGHFMALRRKLIQPIPKHVILDDFYLAMMTMRQGYRVISEPEAVVWEQPTRSMGDEVNRRRRLTAGRFQIISMSPEYLPYLPLVLQWEVISHKFLRLAIPHLMIAALLSNLLFVVLNRGAGSPSFWNSLMNGGALAQAIFYGLAVAGKLLFEKLSQRSKLIKILMLPYFLCATNFAGIAGLRNFMAGKGSVLWEPASRR
jgi:cellulose synthase/poly-beta-1,6-N-acetylglucosamine synthase-like glycosyltransferase